MQEIEKVLPPKDIDPSKVRDRPQLVSLLFFNFTNETKEGKLNIIDVFDHLYVDSTTKTSTPFGVFVRVANAFGAPVRCDVFSPDNVFRGGILFSVKPDYALPDGRRPIQIQIAGRMILSAPVEGTYWFIVSYQGEVLGGCPLLIDHKDLKEDGGEHTRGDG